MGGPSLQRLLSGVEAQDPQFELNLAAQRIMAQLTRHRIRSGLNQEEIAEKMKVPPSVVSRFEGGKNNPTLLTLVRYAKAVGGHLAFSPKLLEKVEDLLDLDEKPELSETADHLLHEWVDGFNRRTFRVEHIYAPDCVVSVANTTMRGYDEVRAYFEIFVHAFPDSRIELVDAVESPERIVIEAKFSGTHRAQLQAGYVAWMPPTGRKIDLPFCTVLDIEGGKAKYQRGYFDQVTFLVQLGVAPSPAQSSHLRGEVHT